MVSRGRRLHKVEDLTGCEVTITKTERGQNSPRNQLHYLCWYKVISPYTSTSRVISLRADDEIGAYAKARQTLKKRGAVL